MKKIKLSGEQIKKMLRAGWLPRFIRNKFPETDPSTITYYRKLLGMPPFPRGGPRDLAAAAKARRLRQAGWTYEKIGAALGVSRQRAHQYIAYKSRAKNRP